MILRRHRALVRSELLTGSEIRSSKRRMDPLRQHNRITDHFGRGILWMTVLVFFLLTSCTQDRGAKNEPVGTFFPLAEGNKWVFLRQGSGTDSAFVTILIDYDSVRTGTDGLEHWYYLQGGGFLKRGLWVRRDSVGDLWCTDMDFQTPVPFLLPSRVPGEEWLFRNFCVGPDTLFVSDTAATVFVPSGDLFQGVRRISAKETCPNGDWEIFLARGVGPVRWRLQSAAWDLIRSQVRDDAQDTAGAVPGHLLSPD